MDFLAIWQFGPALFACKAPYHLDRVRKNADPLLRAMTTRSVEGLSLSPSTGGSKIASEGEGPFKGHAPSPTCS